MAPSWLPTWPSNWPDIISQMRDVWPSTWPRRLYHSGSEAKKDRLVEGESYAAVRQYLEWFLRTWAPHNDDEDLWLTEWEQSLGIAPGGTVADRQSAILAKWRNRGTSYVLRIKAIFCRAFGSDITDDITLTGPDHTTLAQSISAEWGAIATSTEPSARWGASMCYMPTLKKFVLFGGNDGAYDAETWLYDPSDSTWEQLSPSTSPGGRAQGAMAYDETNRRVVLFGGYDGTDLDDTWIFDGEDWTEDTPTTSPTGRRRHCMCWDGNRGKIVLFGGQDGAVLQSDTWAYTYDDTWTDISPAANPSARNVSAMVWDDNNDRVVLHGGNDAGGADAETWELDDTNWSQLSPTVSPPARYGHILGYDHERQRAVLYGGSDGSIMHRDTWEYDGTTWAEVTSYRPSARQYAAGAMDTRRKCMLLYGGIDCNNVILDDTYEYQHIPESHARLQCSMHIHHTDEDTDELPGVARDAIAKSQPVGWTWTCGRYDHGKYGSSANGTEYGTYNTCTYNGS